MKTKIYIFLLVLCAVIPAFAGAPANVQKAFKKLYPKVAYPDWSQKENYYIADFMQNGLEKEIWFDANANLIMTQTDLETMDRVSSNVYNAFSFGQYANWQVENVTLVELPKCPQTVVIEVQQYNMPTTYQLFYSPQGDLVFNRDITYLDDTVWPDDFNCN